jgi:hypothetical protein
MAPLARAPLIPVASRGRPSSQRRWLPTSVIPHATGTLAERPLASLLVYAFDLRFTGSIVVGHVGRGQAQPPHVIFFENGRPSQAHTTLGAASLAEVLANLELVEPAALQGALERCGRDATQLARALVEARLLTVGDLALARAEQLRQRVLALGDCPPETPFALFFDHNLVPRCHERPFSPIDPLPLIVEAIRRRPNDYPMHATVAALTGSVLTLHLDAPIDALELRLESPVIAALRRKPHTVRSLVGARVARAHVVLLTLYVLAVTRCLRRGNLEEPPLSYARRAEPRRVSSYPPPRHSGFYTRSTE